MELSQIKLPALESQLCTIAQGRELKALGVPQTSLFCVYIPKESKSIIQRKYEPKPTLNTPQADAVHDLANKGVDPYYEKVCLFTIAELQSLFSQLFNGGYGLGKDSQTVAGELIYAIEHH